MATITAADVNKLRQITGSGMMDCKGALIEAEGDFEKAIEILRKKGMKVANKRADRNANEGIVLAATTADSKFGAVIMLNCETDFVGKTEEFQTIAKGIIDLAISHKPQDMDALLNLKLNDHTVNDTIVNMTGKTGEKMGLAHYQVIEAPRVIAYNHHGNRLGTLLGLSVAEGTEEIGRELAMQVAAMAPVAIDKDDVDQKTIDQEIEIGKEQARQEGKPEDMLERIALGKLQKFFKESTLLNQEFIKDSKIDVRTHMANHNKDLKVTAFKRLMLGA
jgi:elongation factor Ts